MVRTLLSHSMTFPILSPHKFADVVGNLMFMTLPTETGLRESIMGYWDERVLKFLVMIIVR
jgi:hypothetical protein